MVCLARRRLERFLLSFRGMGGFITERDFDAAEREFPGIQRLYECLVQKPRTFLELMWKYERMVRDAVEQAPRRRATTVS